MKLRSSVLFTTTSLLFLPKDCLGNPTVPALAPIHNERLSGRTLEDVFVRVAK